MYCTFLADHGQKIKKTHMILVNFHRYTHKYIYLHLFCLVHPYVHPHHLHLLHLHPSLDMKQELGCVAALHQAEFSSLLEIQIMCKGMYMYL